jgi:hypothetical protein
VGSHVLSIVWGKIMRRGWLVFVPLLIPAVAGAKSGGAGLAREEALRMAERLVSSKISNAKPLAVLAVTPPVDGIVAVALDPPYREFPNVLLFKIGPDGKTWTRAFEGLSLGIQDEPSGYLDTHTVKAGVDFTFNPPHAPNEYRDVIERMRKERGSVIVAYEKFYHMHPSGAEGYTIDKRQYTGIASELVSDRYKTGYKQDNCMMYDTPRLRSLTLSKSGTHLELEAQTDPLPASGRAQRWRLTFGGLTPGGYILDKTMHVTKLLANGEATGNATAGGTADAAATYGVPILKSGPWTVDPRCPSLMKLNKRSAETVVRTQALIKTSKVNASLVERFANLDVALPRSADEYALVGKSAIVAVDGVSKSAEEHPFSIAPGASYVKPIVCFDMPMGPTDPAFAAGLGRYRNLCFYAIPIYQLMKTSELRMDWNGKRKDFGLARLPLTDQWPKFVAEDPDVKKIGKPDGRAIRAFMNREYCLH